MRRTKSASDLRPGGGKPKPKAELGVKQKRTPARIPFIAAAGALKDQFVVYRDDELDSFKPHSEDAVNTLAERPLETALTEKEVDLLQCAAVTFDRSISMEKVITYPESKQFPVDIQIELQRMPNWLSAMIINRFSLIQAYYKGETLSFLKSINQKIDREFRPEFTFFEGSLAAENLLADQDDRETNQLKAFALKDDPELNENEQIEDVFQKTGANVIFRVTEAIGKWRRTRDNAMQWHPTYVHRVVRKLRECLSLKPAEADLMLTQEDVTHKDHSESEDSEFDDEGKPKYEIIKRKERLQHEADLKIERDILKGQQLVKRKKKKKKKKKAAGGKTDKGRPKTAGTGADADPEIDDEWEDVVQGPTASETEITRRKQQMELDRLGQSLSDKGVGRVAMRRKLFTRGHFRRHSRLLHKGCGERVERPKRLEYHYRADDNFHQYIVWLVSTKFFRFFIMAVIMVNALCLALENDDRIGRHPILFEVLDEVFLAVYLVEAIVKIYAHPLRYWSSGFNCFDFCILVVSLIKACIDWADLADLAILRVLLIVRALRMLRGISLSVQLQVLVAALVETIRTHVISVCLLLVLLIYIAAIVFFYIFTEEHPILMESWGFVPKGMLRMIVFVTLDGWTEILQEFKDAGMETTGRFFNLISIVLGNFMFSNIFIAIIIMNISEATDSYRDRQRLEKQEVVRKKKDMVFRRQKLDMRQLLARQKKSATADFFYLTGQFQKLLRHDDLVSMKDVCTAPLWMDALFNCLLRINHTSNIVMNMHREMADNLQELGKIYASGKEDIKVIRRSRYNRYMKIKAKLALIKREILDLRLDPKKPGLRVTFDDFNDSTRASSRSSRYAVPTPKHEPPKPKHHSIIDPNYKSEPPQELEPKKPKEEEVKEVKPKEEKDKTKKTKPKEDKDKDKKDPAPTVEDANDDEDGAPLAYYL